MDFAGFQSIVLSGLVLGSLYALMSTGLSLVWGTLRLFNFAHGSLVMFGAYIAWTICDNRGLGWGLWPAIGLSMVIMFIIGALLELVLARPFLKRPNAVILVLITTLSASSFLDNLAQLLWGPRMKRLPPMASGKVEILGWSINAQELVLVILAPVLLIALWSFLKTTRLGLAIRSVEQNPKFAQLVGVNASMVYLVTFGLGTCLATAAGIFFGAKSFIVPGMGAEPLLKAFVVVILGGLGSLGGTVLGAYLVGFVEAFSVFYIGLYGTPAILFLVMIVVLIIKPTGLMGED